MQAQALGVANANCQESVKHKIEWLIAQLESAETRLKRHHQSLRGNLTHLRV